MITDIRRSSGTVTFRDCNNLRLPENEHALSETGLRPDETEFIDLTDIPVYGDIKVFSAFSGLKSIRISFLHSQLNVMGIVRATFGLALG